MYELICGYDPQHDRRPAMKRTAVQRPLAAIVGIYLICFALRVIEYIFIRTDQSIFGEAFLHKLAGILILFVALRYFGLRGREIGFGVSGFLHKLLYGLLLGLGTYFVAYGTEYVIQLANGNLPQLEFYVTSYSVDGNIGLQTGWIFYLFSIVGNMINVVMEEGIFRGLFVKLAENKYSFIKAALFSSVLFGFWHIMAPVRSFLDGESSPMGAFMSALLLVVTSAITGLKFSLLTKISGSLWLPMADHFVNNTIINLLHVVTATGADELQVVRISIAQSVSFIVVLVIYIRTKAWTKPTFRYGLEVEIPA